MNAFLDDCRHALRLYVRTPGSSLIAVAVLAISMAFVSAFLSLYVNLALKPHPGFRRGDRITSVGESDIERLTGVPGTLVDRLADETSTIEAAANVRAERLIVGTDGEAAPVMLVTKGFMDLEPRLALGRGFLAEEHQPDAEPVVVLSYRYWQRQLGGDPGVLDTFLEIGRVSGSRFLLNNDSPFRQPSDSDPKPERERARFRIVGVMGEGLARVPSYMGLYEPIVWLPAERVWPMFLGESEVFPRLIPWATYARRVPGVSDRAVANELRARYEIENPDWRPKPGFRPDAVDGLVMTIATHREAKRQLELLLAGSMLLVLVAGANLSLFLLARAPGRRRELGVRLTVGAPMRRLTRQLATEAGLLVVTSGIIGLLGSVWLAAFLKNLPSLREAHWIDAALLDWRIVVLVAAFLLVLSFAVSLAPILGLRRLGIATASRAISARASLAQRLAGTTQIMIAAVLIAAAVAFGWHLAWLVYGDAGYELENRFVVEYLGGVSATGAERIPARERRREALEAIPGVSAVAYGYPIPGNEEAGLFPFQVPDPSDPSHVVEVTRGSLEDRLVDLLGYDLLFGRVPRTGESGVAAVNRSAARALFGRDDVVGERLPAGARSPAYEIVGVLEDLSFGHPLTQPRPYVFESLDNLPYIHAVIEAQLTAAQLQQALARLQRDGVLEGEVRPVRPLAAIRAEVTAPDRVRGAFTIAAALLVVSLSGLGFYGTQRYLVAAGRREYAIRASLGAAPSALGRLVILRGIVLGLPGLVLGGLLAFIVVAWLRGDFVSRAIAPLDVTVLVLVGLMLLLLAASFGPASMARRTQPAPLLRED